MRARLLTRFAAVLSLALVPAACGSDDGRPAATIDASSDGAGDGGAGDARAAAAQAFDDFIADLAGGVCTWLFRCCDVRSLDVISMSRYLTMDDCVAAQRSLLGGVYSESRLAMKDGRVTLDADGAAACVSRISTAACALTGMPTQDPWSRLATCLDPFVGKVEDGDRCMIRDECVPGSRCVPGGSPNDYTVSPTPEGLSPPALLSSAMPVFGTCVAYLKEGDRCIVDPDCAPGLYCRGPEFVCSRPAGDGQPCAHPVDTLSGPHISCNDIDPLKPRLCAGGLCSRLPLEGEPCLSQGYYPPCDPDPALALSCVGTDFNGSGVCKQAVGEGAPCGGSGIPPCSRGLICLPDLQGGLGICSVPPAIGESCVDTICAPGAVCDYATGICVAQGTKRDGVTCEEDFDCASQACGTPVGSTAKVCQPPTYYGGCISGSSPL